MLYTMDLEDCIRKLPTYEGKLHARYRLHQAGMFMNPDDLGRYEMMNHEQHVEYATSMLARAQETKRQSDMRVAMIAFERAGQFIHAMVSAQQAGEKELEKIYGEINRHFSFRA